MTKPCPKCGAPTSGPFSIPTPCDACLIEDGLSTTPRINPRNDVWLPALGRVKARADFTAAALRKVAAMPCTFTAWRTAGQDCRARYREVMGGRMTAEEQRQNWCARCVAADAVERLDSGDVGPFVHDAREREEP